MVKHLTCPGQDVLKAIIAYDFTLIEAEERRDANDLVKCIEVRFTVPGGQVLQAEAHIREIDGLQGFFGSVSDPKNDNSVEFDYIDSMGFSFDGCLTQVIRAVADHYSAF